MAKSETSDDSENSSEEVETPKKSGGGGTQMNKKMSDYEKQRMKRIEENRARMEAMGLKTMAKSLMVSVQNVKKKSEKNGKRKIDDDDDYRPAEDDELQGLSSSAEEDDKDHFDVDDDDDDDEEFTMSRKSKGKKKITKPKKASPKKRVRKHIPYGTSGYVDDDDALMQAIALSLQDSAGFLDVKTQAPQSATAQIIDSSSTVKKGNTHIQEDTGKRKRKKMVCCSLDQWLS